MPAHSRSAALRGYHRPLAGAEFALARRNYIKFLRKFKTALNLNSI